MILFLNFNYYTSHFWGVLAFCLFLLAIFVILKTCKSVFCEPTNYFLRWFFHLLFIPFLCFTLLVFRFLESCVLIFKVDIHRYNFCHCFLWDPSHGRGGNLHSILFSETVMDGQDMFQTKWGTRALPYLPTHPFLYWSLKDPGGGVGRLASVVILLVTAGNSFFPPGLELLWFWSHSCGSTFPCAFAVCFSNFVRY